MLLLLEADCWWVDAVQPGHFHQLMRMCSEHKYVLIGYNGNRKQPWTKKNAEKNAGKGLTHTAPPKDCAQALTITRPGVESVRQE